MQHNTTKAGQDAFLQINQNPGDRRITMLIEEVRERTARPCSCWSKDRVQRASPNTDGTMGNSLRGLLWMRSLCEEFQRLPHELYPVLQ